MSGFMLGMISGIGQVGIHLLSSLVTESFIKKSLIILLSKLVKKTESDADDKLLQAAKEAWGIKE